MAVPSLSLACPYRAHSLSLACPCGGKAMGKLWTAWWGGGGGGGGGGGPQARDRLWATLGTGRP